MRKYRVSAEGWYITVEATSMAVAANRGIDSILSVLRNGKSRIRALTVYIEEVEAEAEAADEPREWR